jgi:hypothetical protein
VDEGFELKIFDHCIFPSWIQRSFVKPWLGHSSSFKSLKMDLKWGKYGAQTREGSRAIFSNFFEINYHWFFSFVFL